jgi:hypothetical protein
VLLCLGVVAECFFRLLLVAFILFIALPVAVLGGMVGMASKPQQFKGPFSKTEKIVGVIAVLVILFAIYHSW